MIKCVEMNTNRVYLICLKMKKMICLICRNSSAIFINVFEAPIISLFANFLAYENDELKGTCTNSILKNDLVTNSRHYQKKKIPMKKEKK